MPALKPILHHAWACCPETATMPRARAPMRVHFFTTVSSVLCSNSPGLPVSPVRSVVVGHVNIAPGKGRGQEKACRCGKKGQGRGAFRRTRGPARENVRFA